ncbi:MAG TPA: histidine kinase [Chitinophagaceae bacterium]|nr:histidine kinase [Chitinophagaceae bacterium]
MPRQIPSLFIVVLIVAFVFASVDIIVPRFLKIDETVIKNETLLNEIVRNWFGTSLFLTIWGLIYFTYHYVMMSRNDQLDKVKLESLLKEMQLKTIKSHINPHFIFNALNSIRALVDENPPRARTAITELSNILRSSLHAEKIEVTPMERELALIKDYLELEHIRFEDRLCAEYCIDESTLDLPVPPMMMQTLVENAIKHGISKQVNGGLIRIISTTDEQYHHLVVQNTGHLSGGVNPDGFGLESTQRRLKLLYGDKASFEIRNIPGNMVEVSVLLPLTFNYAALQKA